MKKEKFKVLDSDSGAVAVGEKRKRLADENKENPTLLLFGASSRMSLGITNIECSKPAT
jgi:hypothetical protein